MAFKDLSIFESDLARLPERTEPAHRALVLIIDDDRSVRASLELALGTRYRVKTSMDADDGVAGMNEDVSVVILDIKMAGKDGFEAYSLLRKKDEDVPIIFHS